MALDKGFTLNHFSWFPSPHNEKKRWLVVNRRVEGYVILVHPTEIGKPHLSLLSKKKDDIILMM